MTINRPRRTWRAESRYLRRALLADALPSAPTRPRAPACPCRDGMLGRLGVGESSSRPCSSAAARPWRQRVYFAAPVASPPDEPPRSRGGRRAAEMGAGRPEAEAAARVIGARGGVGAFLGRADAPRLPVASSQRLLAFLACASTDMTATPTAARSKVARLMPRRRKRLVRAPFSTSRLLDSLLRSSMASKYGATFYLDDAAPTSSHRSSAACRRRWRAYESKRGNRRPPIATAFTVTDA